MSIKPRFTTEANEDGSSSLVVPGDAKVEVIGAVKESTLAEARFDPFSQFKTEPDKYHYRALNIRPQNMRTRQAEGYETIEGSDYGDLILGKIPITEHNRRIAKEANITKARTNAAVDTFKQQANNLGVKTFDC